MDIDELGLTEKQKKFCQEYIYDWNGRRAAIAAGYSEKTAHVISNENLNKPYIQAYINYIKDNLEEQAGISRLMVLNEYKKMAFSSIAHLHNTWIELKDFEALTKEQKDCIESIETKKIKRKFAGDEDNLIDQYVEYVKIKLFSKERALENICKMLGYNPKETQLDTDQKHTAITITFPENFKDLPDCEDKVEVK